MNQVEEVLKLRRIRPTAMRILIWRYLKKNNRAVALTDIEQAFDKSERTTLYRTIKTFEKNGLVHQIDDGTGISKYALCEPNCKCDPAVDLHLHFHCLLCMETTCLTDHKIPHISLPRNFITEEINLVVKGSCDKCNKRSAL